MEIHRSPSRATAQFATTYMGKGGRPQQFEDAIIVTTWKLMDLKGTATITGESLYWPVQV